MTDRSSTSRSRPRTSRPRRARGRRTDSGASRRRATDESPEPSEVEADFGPGVDPDAAEPEPEPRGAGAAFGPIPGLACAGEDCFLKPAADLFAKFFASQRARGHIGSFTRAAFSTLELVKAFRDFLDEEIAIAERAAGNTGKPRYRKIDLE